jgi:FMN-binding domain
MRAAHWVWLPVAAISTSAYATTYFTVEQAQHAIFPGTTFTAAGEPNVWRTSGGGLFIVDRVVGKHEYITVAIGINANGTVKQIEIMDYRESYGYEVRDASWRAQFVGKSASSSLQLGQDIKNISGATLSSKHITDSVKRVLQRYGTGTKGRG